MKHININGLDIECDDDIELATVNKLTIKKPQIVERVIERVVEHHHYYQAVQLQPYQPQWPWAPNTWPPVTITSGGVSPLTVGEGVSPLTVGRTTSTESSSAYMHVDSDGHVVINSGCI